jgi:hypothetical protein
VKRLIAALVVLLALMVGAGAGSGADTGDVTWSGNINQTVAAVDSSGANASFAVTGTDPSNGADVPVTCTPPSGSLFPLGTTTVGCTTTDTAGPASTSFDITVRDETPPNVTAPADVATTTTVLGPKVVTYPAATASDNVDGSIGANCSPASGSAFPIGQTTVTCTATDAAGNTGSATFTVTVSLADSTPPTVNVPSDIATTTTAASGKNVSFTATASDNIDGSITPTCSPASGALFPVGSTTVNCSATDSHGNTGTGSFKVTITYIDTVPPVVSVPGPINANATGPLTPVSFPASANDAVDGTRPVSCSPGSPYPVGVTTVTCTATDTSGNTGQASFTVTVHDVTAPQLTVPADQTAGATSPAGAAVTYSAQATDNVDGTITPSCTPTSGSTFPAKASTLVTCTATDAAHNSTTKTFQVTVNDSAPVITHVNDIVAEANGPGGAAIWYLPPSATDIVDGGLAVNCTVSPGAMFPLGASTINCSSKNSSNQTSTTSFGVLVRDTTPPALPVLGKLSLVANAPVPATNTLVAKFLSVHATDLVDQSPSVRSNAPAVFPFGTTTVTFTAVDRAGNAVTASGTVVVVRGPNKVPAVLAGTSPPDRTPPGNVRKLTIGVSGRSAILRWRSPVGGFDHVAILRAAGGKKPVTVYRGRATRFVDHRLTLGVVYRYLVVAFDSVGNQSVGVVALARPTAQPLYGPAAGQRVSPPAVLHWQPMRGATFYNVQLFRGKKKVFSTWPKTAKLVIGERWSYGGHTQHLLPGRYTWYVWPARGTRKTPRYQALEGFNSFVVVNA